MWHGYLSGVIRRRVNMEILGNIEYRKLQVTGGSTFIVSLPKKWIKNNSLSSGDVVGVECLASGEVQITPHKVKQIRRSVSIDLSKYPKSALYDYLIGAYVSGADEINVSMKDGIPIQQKRIVRRFLRDTRGMEISEDNDKKISIISLLNPNELPLQTSLNRMYLLVTSLVEDTLGVLAGDDKDIISDYEDRERQIDARRLLIDRQVAMALNSPQIERGLGIDRYQAMEHAVMAHYLERMGDHAQTFAGLVADEQTKIDFVENQMPMAAIPIWLSSLRAIIRNTYSKDISVLIKAKQDLAKVILDIEQHENELMSSRARATSVLSEFRISEIVRRLCGYSIDLTETLINMLIAGKTEASDK